MGRQLWLRDPVVSDLFQHSSHGARNKQSLPRWGLGKINKTFHLPWPTESTCMRKRLHPEIWSGLSQGSNWNIKSHKRQTEDPFSFISFQRWSDYILLKFSSSLNPKYSALLKHSGDNLIDFFPLTKYTVRDHPSHDSRQGCYFLLQPNLPALKLPKGCQGSGVKSVLYQTSVPQSYTRNDNGRTSQSQLLTEIH